MLPFSSVHQAPGAAKRIGKQREADEPISSHGKNDDGRSAKDRVGEQGVTKSALETPMMRQFLAIKAQQPDAILFYRMGDFYEMFLRDAEIAAPLLDIALTTRDKGKADAVAMCGVPVHAADQHIQRLTALGYRVAICEQVEDPKTLGSNRLVRREVVEVVTPGLVGDPSAMDSKSEVTLAALDFSEETSEIGLAVLDALTGDFRATAIEYVGDDLLSHALCDELCRIAPREVLISAQVSEELLARLRDFFPAVAWTRIAATNYETDSRALDPEGFSAHSRRSAQRAAAAVIAFVAENQPFATERLARLREYKLTDAMVLDAATRAHLELFENSEDHSRQGTLIDCIDETVTPVGARRLARWLAYPLLDRAAIHERQDAVAYLFERDRMCERLRAALREVRDLERLLAKVARPSATPRDVGALRSSLQALPSVVAVLSRGADDLLDASASACSSVLIAPQPLDRLVQLLEEALIDDPPVIAKGSRGANETGYIRENFSAELDALRASRGKGSEWLLGFEAQERARTGIANLKVRFHPVHGYAIEITKSNLERVPEDYERKQTLANVERFTTRTLLEMESTLLSVRDRSAALERDIFESLRQAVLAESAAIRCACEAVANLDALASLAHVARRAGWVRPTVDASGVLQIMGGRHPVVERSFARQGAEGFVPNDTNLAPQGVQMLVLTGPNMSGKSTYLRQVALIVLLAQVGSFVPAADARIGVVDRVFTRVGASDRLSRGESTFMVEMREASNILAQASQRSLVILDEIGRGTSTYDGLSIAWAVAEYLHDTPGLCPRTLFATHYHELTELARTKTHVDNAHFEVREWGEEVIFLRRLVQGGANRSYGIQVAKLAGLPSAVIERAKQILHTLESKDFENQDAAMIPPALHEKESVHQLGLFSETKSLSEAERDALLTLRSVDPLQMTPLAALSLLDRLVRSVRQGESS